MATNETNNPIDATAAGHNDSYSTANPQASLDPSTTVASSTENSDGRSGIHGSDKTSWTPLQLLSHPPGDLPLRPKRDYEGNSGGGHESANNDVANRKSGSDSDDAKSLAATGGSVHSASGLKHKIVDKTESVKYKANNPPGGFDTTPLPDFPPGYTVKFTFHSASNLPIADITSGACDPFIHATLTAAVPKRHKEDPDLIFRTRTIRRETEPKWEQEWIVANIPRTGFRIKCRLYDEDYPDHDDRLGNVTYYSPSQIDEKWEGLRRHVFEVKKRMGSKRAYLLKAAESMFHKAVSMTPLLVVSIEVVGKSEGPGAQMYTVGPTAWIQHFSPMIGRLTGVRVNKDESDDEKEHHKGHDDHHDDWKTKKYDFQASEIQLQGPVNPKLYHRYVEFRAFVGPMFSSHGLRGKVLNKMLHKQHRRIYNFDSSTKYGTFPPCSREASLQFLKMVHFDEGNRVFTYVLTLDGLLRFTETGKEFGIDLLSKHTMHSDVQTYIACSGEFFVRKNPDKLQHHHHHHHDREQDGHKRERSRDSGRRSTESHRTEHAETSASPSTEEVQAHQSDPSNYQLVIDNDSGTYRPDKSILPLLQEFLSKNFPDLSVTARHWGDEELQSLKKAQHAAKKSSGRAIRMVLNKSPSASSISSSDESRLSDMESDDEREEAAAAAAAAAGEGGGDGGTKGRRSKKEIAWEVLEDPKRIGGLKGMIGGHHHHHGHHGHGHGEEEVKK